MPVVPATIASGFHFLEAPRWRDDRIWFSDFYGHRVHSAREDGEDLRTEAVVEQQPAGLGWLPDGRLLVVSMLDRKVLRREQDGTMVTHADLGAHATGHANDMVLDAEGRAYVGNFGFDLMNGAPLETASLHRVDPDGTVTEAADGLYFPNGSVITSGRVLIVNETFGNRCTAFDVTADGDLVNRRIWAEFGPLPGQGDQDDQGDSDPGEGDRGKAAVAPDGACLDAEGALWIADAMGSRLLRVADGEVTDELRPDSPVYACALGGADGRTLYACA
ncbi:MAG: SMP-30/gluconolactonase/LRE family protein, partial [Trebonia sp.]